MKKLTKDITFIYSDSAEKAIFVPLTAEKPYREACARWSVERKILSSSVFRSARFQKWVRTIPHGHSVLKTSLDR